MSRLESWQRYRKSTPCPICGGYGAYKPENRCKGFLTADGQGAYCSNVDNSEHHFSKWFEAVGMYLYYHPLDFETRAAFQKILFPTRQRGKRGRLQGIKAFGARRAGKRKLDTEAYIRPPHPREFG